MKIVLWFGLSILSGAFYRLGGWEKGNRLFRLLGCPLTALGLFWGFAGLNVAYWWLYLLTFGLMAGAVASYWGLDEEKFGYWAHALSLSLAVIPLYWTGIHWWAILIRSIILIPAITLWSEYTSIDTIEEFGRGFFITATIPLLLL